MKVKDSKMKPYSLRLGNISKYFAVGNIRKNQLIRISFFC